MRGPFIERTSNKVENYYRQTDPNQIKKNIQNYNRNTRLFKPKKKMKKMDTKTREKFQPPIT